MRSCEVFRKSLEIPFNGIAPTWLGFGANGDPVYDFDVLKKQGNAPPGMSGLVGTSLSKPSALCWHYPIWLHLIAGNGRMIWKTDSFERGRTAPLITLRYSISDVPLRRVSWRSSWLLALRSLHLKAFPGVPAGLWLLTLPPPPCHCTLRSAVFTCCGHEIQTGL